MGGCFSTTWVTASASTSSFTTNVISFKGELREYTLPVTASQILEIETSLFSSSSSSSSPAAAYFICNSEHLLYDEFIPVLSPETELEPSQIYFILPVAKLQYRLGASDMAALAVKASVALKSSSKAKDKRIGKSNVQTNDGRSKNKARISPLVMMDVNQRSVNSAAEGFKKEKNLSDKTGGLGVSRTGSMRKLQRYSSKRAKMAVRSFRLSLNTIYEGSVLQFY